MRSLIQAFPAQLKLAWETAQSSPIDLNGWMPENALILGMGGSGISGAIASKMLADASPVPIVANNDYTIVGSDNFSLYSTLTIATNISIHVNNNSP